MSIKKIAALAGTSVSTVSRVLNDPEHRCHIPGLEKKIWEIAAEINYVPDKNARALKQHKPSGETTRPFEIDVYLTRFESISRDAFFQELFSLLRKEFLEFGCAFGTILNASEVIELMQTSSNTPGIPYKTNADAAGDLSLSPIKEKKDSGLIILGKCPPNLIGLLKKRYPFIAGIDRNPTDYQYDEVVCNGATAAEMAVEHLISLGHRNIAYIGDCSYESRYMGYYQTLLSHRLPLNHANVYPSDQTMESGETIMNEIIASDNRPTAVFCANDMTAIGALAALNKNRRKDYNPSVISIDNIKASEKTTPMLTTIHIPKDEMAHMALTLLTDRRAGRHHENVRIELPCRLMLRESCFLP